MTVISSWNWIQKDGKKESGITTCICPGNFIFGEYKLMLTLCFFLCLRVDAPLVPTEQSRPLCCVGEMHIAGTIAHARPTGRLPLPSSANLRHRKSSARSLRILDNKCYVIDFMSAMVQNNTKYLINIDYCGVACIAKFLIIPCVKIMIRSYCTSQLAVSANVWSVNQLIWQNCMFSMHSYITCMPAPPYITWTIKYMYKLD